MTSRKLWLFVLMTTLGNMCYSRYLSAGSDVSALKYILLFNAVMPFAYGLVNLGDKFIDAVARLGGENERTG